jgi:sulfate adenylyltransferase subunit 1 (EFTu-like GTPase family)
VVRPMSDEHHDYRGYAGEVASGVFRAGDEVVVLPSGRESRIAAIDSYDGEMEEAYPPLSPSGRYRIKHTARTALAKVDQVLYRIDVNSLHRDQEAEGLELNEIGKLRLRLSAPLFVDQYRRNRVTGSFILIDESTNDTVGAGMVL